MIGILAGMPSVLQAFLATLFTWGMRAAGAALVFGAKKVNRKLLDAMLAFAAGVMIAASFWSLLAPAIDLAERGPLPAVVPPLVGFLLGGVFIRGLDLVLPHLHPGHPISDAEGIETSWRRSVLLVSAITLHNIPEGLAIGVAFGAVAAGIDGATLGAAIALAIGIGLQNFPEGTAVSMPLRREGMSRGHDLRRRRRAHPRGQTRQPRHSRPRPHGRLRGDDDARRLTGVARPLRAAPQPSLSARWSPPSAFWWSECRPPEGVSLGIYCRAGTVMGERRLRRCEDV